MKTWRKKIISHKQKNTKKSKKKKGGTEPNIFPELNLEPNIFPELNQFIENNKTFYSSNYNNNNYDYETLFKNISNHHHTQSKILNQLKKNKKINEKSNFFKNNRVNQTFKKLFKKNENLVNNEYSVDKHLFDPSDELLDYIGKQLWV